MTNQIPGASPSRDAAWSLLTEFTQSPSLLKHALAVESCVRAYGEQEANRRGLVGDDASRLIDSLQRHRAAARFRLRALSLAQGASVDRRPRTRGAWLA